MDLGQVRAICEAAMREYGVPARVRTDDGAQFGGTGLLRQSKLSLGWMKLGIVDECIQAGRPQQNGRHERIRRTLKEETTKPAASSLRAQQSRLIAFATCSITSARMGLEQPGPSEPLHSKCGKEQGDRVGAFRRLIQAALRNVRLKRYRPANGGAPLFERVHSVIAESRRPTPNKNVAVRHRHSNRLFGSLQAAKQRTAGSPSNTETIVWLK